MDLPFSADSNVTDPEEAALAQRILAVVEKELGENVAFTLLWDVMDGGRVHTRVVSNADRGYRLLQLVGYIRHERNRVAKTEASDVKPAN